MAIRKIDDSIPRSGPVPLTGTMTPSEDARWNIGSPELRINRLYVKEILTDSLTGSSTASDVGTIVDADTVDGIHASATPTANYLYPLNSNAVFPSTVYPDALLTDGSRDLTGQLESTVTTGTAPFVIASTTLVTNLNADLLDGYHASEFVINYATPNLTFGTSNVIGSANSVIRSDATIAIFNDGANPENTDADIAGTGSDAYAARRDHKHDTNTGTPGADSVGVSASGPGSATTLALSDHYHNIDEGMAPTWTGTHTFNVDIQVDANIDFVGAQSITTTSGDLTVSPTNDLILNPGNGLVKLDDSDEIRSSTYASQTTGFHITGSGDADFRYLFADELHAKSFIADLEQALAGGQIIAKSVGILSQDFVLPSAGNSQTLWVYDLPGQPDTAIFEANDFVGLRTFSRSSGTLTIAWAWGQVTSYTDGTGGNDGQQSWTWTRNATYPGSATGTIYADSVVLDFGTSGMGFHEVNAADGAYGANSPYAQVVTWATYPGNQTVRTRIGNLYGITGTPNEYGMFAGEGTASTDARIFASSAGLELYNMDLSIYSGGGNVFLVNSSTPYLSLGSTAPTTFGSGTGVWMGSDSGTYKWRVGDPSGRRIQWDNTDLRIYGSDADTYLSTAATGITGVANGNTWLTLDNTPQLVLGYSTEWGKVVIDTGGIDLYGGGDVVIQLQSDGDARFGTTSNANMFWDESAGQLLFRSGTTPQVFIDTDGIMKFGGSTWSDGTIELSTANGITVNASANAWGRINYEVGGALQGWHGASGDTGSGYLYLQSRDYGTQTGVGVKLIAQKDTLTSDLVLWDSSSPYLQHIISGGTVWTSTTSGMDIEAGLAVGGTVTPTADDIRADGDIACAGGFAANSSGANPNSGWFQGVAHYATTGFYLNDSSDSFLNIGMILDQNAYDDNIISLKSSDVAHGMTTLQETDTFAAFLKATGGTTGGGLRIFALTEATEGIYLQSSFTTPNTAAASTSSTGAIMLAASQKSSTSHGLTSVDTNLVVIREHGTAQFVFKETGWLYANGGSTTFDEYDDLALIEDISTAVAAQEDPIGREYQEFVTYNRDVLEATKLVSFDDEANTTFLNLTRFPMLFIGAFRQMGERMKKMEAALEANGIAI